MALTYALVCRAQGIIGGSLKGEADLRVKNGARVVTLTLGISSKLVDVTLQEMWIEKGSHSSHMRV